jgi:uncharacterized protein (DUF1778 family)
MSVDLKKERFDVRVPANVKQQIEYAAELQGRTVSDFIVAAALSEATEVIQKQKILKLCVDDSTALAEALATKPVINKKSVQAARRYKERINKV